MEDVFAEDRAIRERAKADQMKRVASIAQELGTRGAARRLGIDPDTVTQWLQAMGARPIEPVRMVMKFERSGRGFRVTASGLVRRYQGKQPKTVVFKLSAKAPSSREALELVLAKVREVAGRRHARVASDGRATG